MQRSRLLLLLMMTGLLALVGCMKGEQTVEELDVPEEVDVADEENDEENDEVVSDKDEDEDLASSESEETVARELYLLDESGLVVPQTIELPKSESAATQALEYLVKDGPITDLLPNGFQAVLPVGTEIIGLNLEDDGTLIVDVSEDFTDYEPENELKILQSMTHTLTQFDSVEKIKLWINGENQSEMPVNGTPLSEGFSRSNGINIEITEKPDVQSSEVTTIYYPKQYEEDNVQFVPVTTYVNDKQDFFSSVIQAIIDGPSYDLKAKNVFNDQTRLLQKPTLEDGVLQLEFSEDILKDQEEEVIADEVIETLARTLTMQDDVDAIQVNVQDVSELMGENGDTYNEPVNVQHFEGREKM